jgi:hypothetical protein
MLFFYYLCTHDKENISHIIGLLAYIPTFGVFSTLNGNMWQKPAMVV